VPDFITLSCPLCGGRLEVTPDLDRFTCAYCGQEHLVRRTPSAVSLAPVPEAVEKIAASVDRTASELAIPRLKSTIGELERRRVAVRAASAAMKAIPRIEQTGAIAAKPLAPRTRTIRSPEREEGGQLEAIEPDISLARAELLRHQHIVSG
jgi:hypothetical protein